MKNPYPYLTAGELARLHGLNKRTLHYYDEAGIFSPVCKGENGYRYYSFEQSMELEHILALRELDMSIEEIKAYLQHPDPDAFCRLAEDKITEIDKTIRRLKQLKTLLREKKDALEYCKTIYHGKIGLTELPRQYLLMTPLPIRFDTHDSLINGVGNILEHLKDSLQTDGYRRNCGSFISLEKIKARSFHPYDGIFTQMDTKNRNLFVRPAGMYLRGFCVGDWDQIPEVYASMLQFAEENQLLLTGYAYERGLNEFAIAGEEEYITQIEICTA